MWIYCPEFAIVAMYAVVIDGVSEAHGFPPGGNLIDRDFLIHTLGFLEEEIVSNTRLPFDPNESSGCGLGSFRPYLSYSSSIADAVTLSQLCL